jgi:glutathione peroxidase
MLRRSAPATFSLLAMVMGMALPWTAQAQGVARAAVCPALLDHRQPRLQDDAPQDLCQFRGRVLLVVNTASYCGYTPQYEGLEKLQARFGPRGLSVLGFPSNDFGAQEPKANKDIAEFCFNTYGVKFPMFAKSAVTGKSANPLFAALTQATGQPPKWNFHKYLIDREGRVVASFQSQVEPTDPQITSRIERLLGS